MLIAIALSGLAAAFALPIMLSSDEEDENLEGLEPEEEAPEGDLLDDPLDLPDAVADLEDFVLAAGAGHFEVADFDPETDVFRLEMNDLDAQFQTGHAEDGTPEIYATLQNGEEMTLSFPGLTEVPGDAVDVIVPHGDDDAPTVLSLSDVMDAGAVDWDTHGATHVFVLDGWDETAGDGFDDAVDDLADYLPVAPGSGDDVDVPTDPIDDLQPVSPSDPDAPDTLPDPLPDVTPVAPNPGDEVLPIEPLDPDTADTPTAPIPGGVPVAPNPGDEMLQP